MTPGPGFSPLTTKSLWVEIIANRFASSQGYWDVGNRSCEIPATAF